MRSISEYKAKFPKSYLWLACLIIGVTWLILLAAIPNEDPTIFRRIQGGIGLGMFFIGGFHLSRYIVFGSYSKGIDEFLDRVITIAIILIAIAGFIFIIQLIVGINWRSPIGLFTAGICFATNFILLSSSYQLFRRLSSIKSQKHGGKFSKTVYFLFLFSNVPLFVIDLIPDIYYQIYIVLASIPLIAFFANPRWLFVFTESEKRKLILSLVFLVAVSGSFFQVFMNLRTEGLIPVSFWALLPNALILVFASIGFLLNFLMYIVFAGTQNFSTLQQKEFETLIDVQTIANVEANDFSIYKNLGSSLKDFIGSDSFFINKIEEGKIIEVDNTSQFSKPIRDHILQELEETPKFSSQHFKYIPKYINKSDVVSLIEYSIQLSNSSIAQIVLVKEKEHSFDTFTCDLAYYLVKNHSSLIDNFKRIRYTLAEERKKQDKVTAKLLQERLLPENELTFKNLHVIARAQTFEEVGGDYFDFTETTEGKLNIIIADVAGKGTRAAYHASHMKGIFQTIAYRDVSVDQMVIESNKAVGACFDQGVFISAVIGNWDPESNVFTYYRAGHCPIILWKQSTKTAEYLEDQGLGFGIIRSDLFQNNVKSSSIKLEVGDKIVLYTDGVTEYSGDTSPEEYGYDRLLKFIQENGNIDSETLIGKLSNNIIDFNKSPEVSNQSFNFEDDITILVLTVQ